MRVLFGSIFVSSNFYQLDLHNMMMHQRNRTQNQTFLDLVVVIGSACLLIFLIEYMGVRRSVHYWVWRG